MNDPTSCDETFFNQDKDGTPYKSITISPDGPLISSDLSRWKSQFNSNSQDNKSHFKWNSKSYLNWNKQYNKPHFKWDKY
jgi:hypothetical protein